MGLSPGERQFQKDSGSYGHPVEKVHSEDVFRANFLIN